MAKFSRIEVITRMQDTGIIPIFYHSDPEVCRNVISACYKGGINIFEFTNRGDFAHELFSELSKWVVRELPGMMMGSGSIVDPATASLYIQMGANFIVSPVLNPEMSKVCNRRKILWIPGCGSVSEISYAEELGAEFVKIFPGMPVGGPAFIKAVKGPCPWSSIMPTGGVDTTLENLKGWFDAGASCVGIGSNLISADFIRNEDWDALSAKVAETLNIVRAVRKK
jgi:2-dehydro-3-deoxyphosphogluconate aldolase/(4S)-4-hydroxy-2-oxoglutarate aldolase